MKCCLASLLASLGECGTIYLIRHGEKVSSIGCLSAQGEARAQGIVDIFNGTQFKKPVVLYANNYTNRNNCERCVQTITPISEHLQLAIDSSFGCDAILGGNQAGAEAMLATLKRTGGPILTAWEHGNVQNLTADLGVDRAQIPDWEGGDYDSCYVLQFDEQQKITSFTHSHEHWRPPPEPAPTPAPGPAQWDCHTGSHFKNSLHLKDVDGQQSMTLDECQKACLADTDCHVVGFHTTDSHCRTYQGAITASQYGGDLESLKDHQTCIEQ
jgi:hypothetical protein